MSKEKTIDQDNISPVRLASVDAFRGFAIMSMILVNFLAFFSSTPSFLKHAHGQSMTFADLVAPLFLFVLGMMYRKSLVRRASRTGRSRTYLHYVRRYLLVLVLGTLGGCVAKMRITLDWGILQAIGAAGILALPFMELAWAWRTSAALLLLVLHGFGTIPFAQDTLAVAEHGGPLSTLAWAAAILLSSIVGDLCDAGKSGRNMKRIAIFGLVLAVMGLAVAPFIPVSKALVSPSYVLVATGISAVVLVGFIAISDKARVSVPTLEVLGRNALLIFLVHYVLVRLGHSFLDKATGLVVVLSGAAMIYVACYSLALILDRKRIYLRL